MREAVVTLEDLEAIEAKKEEASKRAEEKKASKDYKKAAFVIERDDTGLFYVRLDGKGTLPERLQGKRFTSKFYLENELLQVERDAKGEKRETIFKT